MKTIILDPGHGGKDQGDIYHENRRNLTLALKVREKLLERYRVKVLMTRTRDRSKSLRGRVCFANQHHGDYFCSIHHHGTKQFESYIFSGQVHPQTRQGQDIIHRIIQEKLSRCKVLDGGRKQTDSVLLERVAMRAILIKVPEYECFKSRGSMDITASAIAEGLAAAMALPSVDKPLYRVVAGSFINKKKAGERVSFLEQQQIDAFVVETTMAGETYFRVLTGAYRNRRFAEKRMSELKKMGLCEAFIAIGNATEAIEPVLTKILGTTRLHGQEMDEYVRYLNPDAPRLGKYYEDFGSHYGVRGDIAFAQALYDTHHFRFTDVVEPEQHNYCRLGSLSRHDPGDSFPTPQSGVLAHIQHLYALASNEPFPEGYPLADRNFKSVERGRCPTWIDLTPSWAEPNDEYGQMILNQYEQMADFLKWTKRRFHWIRKLIDLICL
ncbi:MAG TPA: N-acetylmuramoyl-L-alanine amidase [Bacillales bacterium]|nr:N-acetylmuramoyl-L-alanine amidase [Bacillales bacterium]